MKQIMIMDPQHVIYPGQFVPGQLVRSSSAPPNIMLQQQTTPGGQFVQTVLGGTADPSTAFAQSYRLLLENCAAPPMMAGPRIQQPSQPLPMLGLPGNALHPHQLSAAPFGVSPQSGMLQLAYQQSGSGAQISAVAGIPHPSQQLFKPASMLGHAGMFHGAAGPLLASPLGPHAGGVRVADQLLLANPRSKRLRHDNVSESASTASDDDLSDSWSDEKRSRPSPSSAKRQLKDRTPGLGGERRLKIDFSSLGVVGPKPQYFGKSGMVIPDGLSGTHEMHSQHWKFLVTHEQSPEGVTVINWTVTNLNSNKTTSITETPFQAKERQKTGNTICSVVMRKAIEQRVIDLEDELKDPAIQSNAGQASSIQTLIRELRPKQRNEGILFFGLRHACVQKRSPDGTPAADAKQG